MMPANEVAKIAAREADKCGRPQGRRMSAPLQESRAAIHRTRPSFGAVRPGILEVAQRRHARAGDDHAVKLDDGVHPGLVRLTDKLPALILSSREPSRG